jgi:hypothetical protein
MFTTAKMAIRHGLFLSACEEDFATNRQALRFFLLKLGRESIKLVPEVH